MSEEELNRIMKQKLYAGFSLAPQIRKLIKNQLQDEFNLSLEDLEKHLKDSRYYKHVNELYKN